MCINQVFTKQAAKDLGKIKYSDKNIYKKIVNTIKDFENINNKSFDIKHLKYELSGYNHIRVQDYRIICNTMEI